MTDTTKIPSSPAALIAYLTRVEVSPCLAPDTRRVLRDERLGLTVALSRGVGVAERAAEAHRVATMWLT